MFRYFDMSTIHATYKSFIVHKPPAAEMLAVSRL